MRSKLLLLAMAVVSVAAHAAATITIVSGDADGKGFSDPTPVDPVGGNMGVTLGEQRRNAFQAAADKWGAVLNSSVEIRVLATWEPLSCTEASAVLGSAGAAEVFRDFVNAPRTGAWYSKAQANALSGVDQDPQSPDIVARFNVNLGKPGCLTGVYFYLGLDGQHGDNTDLVTVLTHEFAHGLGFQTFTSGLTGAFLGRTPSAWDFFLLDTATGKTWDQMTASERIASSIRTGKLAWNGSSVNTAGVGVLALGTPGLRVTQPDSAAGSYVVGSASFGPQLADPPLAGEVASFIDATGGLGLACDPLSPDNTALVAGKIALVDRGTCTFVVKAANLQLAGAIAVVVVDNVAGSPPTGLAGADSTILIPSVRISKKDGASLRAALAETTVPFLAVLGVNASQLRGADADGHVLLNATDPFISGSSVSHFDASAFPNQLMEAFISDDLTHEVAPPFDLTLMLLRDIGWP